MGAELTGAPDAADAQDAAGVRAAVGRGDAVVRALRAAGCVFAEDEARVLLAAADDPSARTPAGDAWLAAAVARRCAGEPLELVVGWAEFCGLRIPVEPGVFVPRRRTELLARTALELVGPGSVVVDLCCGAGAVAAAVVAGMLVAGVAVEGAAGGRPETAGVELHAADLDPVAVRCARRTLAGTGAQVHEGDLFAALPPRLRGRIDVLVANTPYVPSAEVALLPAEARVHEPRRALDGGPDGLDVQRRVAADAARWLRPGGALLVETSAAQVPAAVAVLVRAGLRPRVVEDEDLGATALVAVLPRP